MSLSSEPVLVGIDLGTSGLKCVALDRNGRTVAETDRPLRNAAPTPDACEIDVAVWRRALDESFEQLARELAPRTIEGVGLSGQMHGLVLVDADGTALRPAILWPDRRARSVSDAWRDELDPSIRSQLANPIAPGMAGPMLEWLTDREPEVVARAAAALSPKDALRLALVPGVAAERSDASATLLWNAETDDWHRRLCDARGIDPALLPPIVASASIVGRTRLPHGLGSDVPVVAGGADTALAVHALRTVDPTARRLLNLGTGIQIIDVDPPDERRGPEADQRLRRYATVDGGHYSMIALAHGGLALESLARTLGIDWDRLVALAETTPAGANGLRFYPGVGFDGLRTTTDVGDLARSGFEGVVFSIRQALEQFGSHLGSEPITLAGGGGRSALVRQLLADTLHSPIDRVELRSASAVGAALLAAVGTERPCSPAAAHVGVEPCPDAALDSAYEVWADSSTPLAIAFAHR